MKVDIVIPNFNGSHLLAQNLPKVLASFEDYEGGIIIVDDGSSKPEVLDLERFLEKLNSKKITLHKHDKNKGFSSAVNTGVSISDADIVVLLNSDVVPQKNFLESPLKKFEDDSNLFAVGCMDESVEGEKIVKRGRGLGYWKRGMLHHKKGEVGKSDTFWVSGGSSFYRRKIYLQLGGMDEIYNPFYWEDIDLSYRAQKAGYKILFDNASSVSHYHEEGAIKSSFSEEKVNKIAYRNQFIFIWKNITSPRLLASHFIFLPIYILSAFIRFDFIFLQGFFLAMLMLPAIIERRQKLRKYNNVSDTEIIKSIS